MNEQKRPIDQQAPEAPPEERETLWLITFSPTIWAVHFLLSYMAASVWCAKVAGRGGALVAVRGDDGRYAVIGSRAGNYELTRWLERDGDGRPARDALRAKRAKCDGVGCVIETNGLRIAVSHHASATDEDCRNADILIGGPRRPKGCTRPLVVLDRWKLRDDGTHAIYLAKDPGAPQARIARVESVSQQRGARPWTERPQRRTERNADNERPSAGVGNNIPARGAGASNTAAPILDDDDQ